MTINQGSKADFIIRFHRSTLHSLSSSVKQQYSNRFLQYALFVITKKHLHRTNVIEVRSSSGGRAHHYQSPRSEKDNRAQRRYSVRRRLPIVQAMYGSRRDGGIFVQHRRQGLPELFPGRVPRIDAKVTE